MKRKLTERNTTPMKAITKHQLAVILPVLAALCSPAEAGVGSTAANGGKAICKALLKEGAKQVGKGAASEVANDLLAYLTKETAARYGKQLAKLIAADAEVQTLLSRYGEKVVAPLMKSPKLTKEILRTGGDRYLPTIANMDRREMQDLCIRLKKSPETESVVNLKNIDTAVTAAGGAVGAAILAEGKLRTTSSAAAPITK